MRYSWLRTYFEPLLSAILSAMLPTTDQWHCRRMVGGLRIALANHNATNFTATTELGT